MQVMWRPDKPRGGAEQLSLLLSNCIEPLTKVMKDGPVFGGARAGVVLPGQLPVDRNVKREQTPFATDATGQPEPTPAAPAVDQSPSQSELVTARMSCAAGIADTLVAGVATAAMLAAGASIATDSDDTVDDDSSNGNDTDAG